MPNTGILYTSDEEFEVTSIYRGKVIDILEDEFFGKCVILEHNDNLKSYYYGIDNLMVAKGDEITTGDVIGTSKNNEILNNKKSFLLEVYLNNKLINPEEVINSNINDYE